MRETINTDKNHAIVEIDIEEVKNKFRRNTTLTPITISILHRTRAGYKT